MRSPRMGRGKRIKEVKSNLTDNESAKMTTSKGTIQGYNGVATVDKKHQIVIDAQAFSEGQEHHTLQPVLEMVEARFKKLGIAENIYQKGTVVTADTGFANEANMKYLHERRINGYIPDNQFRSRDPKFTDQKDKYGKRHQNLPDKGWRETTPASAFQFDPVNLTCICPTGKSCPIAGNEKQTMARSGYTLKGVCCNVGTAQRNTDACRTQARLTIATVLGDRCLLSSRTNVYPIILTG